MKLDPRYLAVAVEAALAAGRLQLQYFRREFQIQKKGPIDLVTEADLLQQRLGAGARVEYVGYDYDNRMIAGNTDENGVPCGATGCLYSRPADRTDAFFNVAPKLGLAFDGDGDRIGAVDGQGRVIWGDQLLMIYAEDLLRMAPGSTIIADVKASRALFEHVAAKGGRPLMWKTGHSLIKSKMKEVSSPLAGEMSGPRWVPRSLMSR